MQLHVKFENGPSPGVVITGSRDDLLAFAEHIKTGVTSVESGPTSKCGVPAVGSPCDWIQVVVAKNMEGMVRDHRIKTRGIFAFVGLFYLSLPIAAYLIYRGIRSFF